jgi:hypothetical protein
MASPTHKCSISTARGEWSTTRQIPSAEKSFVLLAFTLGTVSQRSVNRHQGPHRLNQSVNLVYWDLDSAGLHERRLWGERKIPWQEVIRVSAWNPEQTSSDFLAVHYARSAPMSDRGSVIANPDDRKQFLAGLRRYAPLTVFLTFGVMGWSVAFQDQSWKDLRRAKEALP